MTPMDHFAGAVLPWVMAATALYFAWGAVLYLNRLQVGWGVFALVMTAINVRNFIGLRSNYRRQRELVAQHDETDN